MKNDPEVPGSRALGRLIRFAILHRWLVIFVATAVAVLGAISFACLPIDAVPDITTVQVVVNAVVEGMPPNEVEKQVTLPVETAMAGVPGVVQVRSLSRYGLSQVTVVFKDGTNIYFARQLVGERLREARDALPEGQPDPELGPIATGLGEIFTWTVEARPNARKADGTPYTPTDLREIQDWEVKPRLRAVPGVTEVNTIGGYRKQYHVTPDPPRLAAYGLSLHDLALAIEANNGIGGGGALTQAGEQVLVRTSGRLVGPRDIEQVVVATVDKVPIRVSDVATVGAGQELRTGAASQNAQETVLGTAMMLIGENSRVVAKRVADRLEEVNRTLPEGIVAHPVYDRTRLVEATLRTVSHNLIEGAALVVAVLFLMLGNLTAALIAALVIPVSMLFASSGMLQGGISANLLSLGAIDFGIIVDGAVVLIENIQHRLAQRRHELGRALTAPERHQEAYAGSLEVARPTVFGLAIIMVVYLPILTLSGIEGKMFRPMAQVVLLVLAGATLFTFTLVPALAAMAMPGGRGEHGERVMRLAQRAYGPSLRIALERRWIVVGASTVFVVICLMLAPRLGTEFVTRLDEGDVAIEVTRIPGTSLEQALAMEQAMERTVKAFPEVALTYSSIGTAEIASDPMPPGQGDLFVILKPRRQWPDPGKPKAVLVGEMERALDRVPGNIGEFTQPIQMRFNELIAGVRSDLGVKVFGEDLAVARQLAERVADFLRSVRGASGVRVEQVSGLPTLTVEIDRTACARYGIASGQVQDLVRAALAGEPAGEIMAGDRRFDVVVRLPDVLRNDLHVLERLPVPVSGPESAEDASPSPRARRAFVPLDAVAQLRLEAGPNQISREDGARRVVVQANVRGRDLGSFVKDARQIVEHKVSLPAGYWLEWGGQYENLQAAQRRLAIAIPLALLLILGLLLAAIGSVKDALLVFSGVPFALTGGVIALAVRGLPISITAGIGFITLSGVAVLNGLVMISRIRQLRKTGRGLEVALHEGCSARLRQVLMIGLVASLGFLPMAFSTGTGAEVQRPLATVVIGGILSSTFLTLLVLPALYRLAHRDVEAAEEEI